MTDYIQSRFIEPKPTCNICLSLVGEVCPDGACRDCHCSITWEECCTFTHNARRLLELGHSREDVLELYPDAKI